MDTQKTDFTPQDSLDMIQRVIDKTRSKYEENGVWVMIWGLGVMIAGISQYLMIRNGMGNLAGYAWVVTMIPLFIINMVVNFQKGRQNVRENRKGIDAIGVAWLMAGCMAMLSGFIFNSKFGASFTTVMFLPFCVAAVVTGLSLQKPALIFMSVLSVGISYAALYIPWMYHSLVAAGIACVLFFIPGIILWTDYKKRHRV
ncbi:MAG: hypothetical protein KTR13_04535 [Saprospiraceae bacterium]|nr:hypothetical protein [Saprospiraceae bacterium]